MTNLLGVVRQVHGVVRPGKAGCGEAWWGLARRGEAHCRFLSTGSRQQPRGGVWRGEVWWGTVWSGKARQG